MKPKDYLEFHYEGVTICMNDKRQAVILFTPVGGAHMYTVHVVDRGTVGPLLEDRMTREWTRGPAKADRTGMFHYYYNALETARGVCGWKFDDQPSAEEVKLEQLEEDARQTEAAEEAEGWTYHGHPSLTASERNPSLTKRGRR